MSRYVSPHAQPVLVAVIGGSGVYALGSQHEARYYDMDTPFGRPSGPVCVATIDNKPCAFLPRHGYGHTLAPSEINYRANVCALKQLGVRYVLAINAVGSLDAQYAPGDLVVVDQMIDKTYARAASFFGGGIVAHVDFAHPTSRQLNTLAYTALQQCMSDMQQQQQRQQQQQETSSSSSTAAGEKKTDTAAVTSFAVHPRGTLVTMEGPQFSTRAESLLNKQLGGHLIGMTAATEARLAREAEMAYTVVAMVTDMDAWSDAPHVDVATVVKVMHANASKAQVYAPAIVRAVHHSMFEDSAHHALACAIVTRPEHVSREAKERLAPLLAEKYPQYAV